jgi:hypothetical protein
MNRQELIQKCKDLGIKGFSAKTKPELLQLIAIHEQPVKPSNDTDTPSQPIFAQLMHQLTQQVPKDKSRKVCKQCHELGHGVTSVHCKINIEANDKLKQKIKTYVSSQNCLDDKTVDDHCTELSASLGITPNQCKTLYSEIPLNELLDRKMDIAAYLQIIAQTAKQCSECSKPLVCIQTNTNRVWKGADICDTCWSTHSDVRDQLWDQIKKYRQIECSICQAKQTYNGERFHYDHLNMFDKDKSVCSMINECMDAEDICREIDKCQILCLSCHHIVTDVEHRFGFTRIKQVLTRKMNQGEFSEEQYEAEMAFYQQVYAEKMQNVYAELRNNYVR